MACMALRARLARVGNKVLPAILAAMVGGVPVMGIRSASASSLIPVKIIVSSGGSDLPVMVAYEQGFFRRHGLAVTITKSPNTKLYPNVLASGQYDIGAVPTPTLLAAVLQGLPLTAIANEFNTSPGYPLVSVVVAKGSGITTLADLKGKTVATVATNGNIYYSFEYDLVKHHLASTAVKPTVVNFSNMLAELNSNAVQAVLSIPPFTEQMTAAGDRVIARPYLSIGSSADGQDFTTATSWASSHRKAINDFKAALSDANKFMVHHRAATVKILQQYTGVSLAAAKTTPLPDYRYTLTFAELKQWERVMAAVTGEKSYLTIPRAKLLGK